MSANDKPGVSMRLVADFSEMLANRLIVEAAISSEGEALILLAENPDSLESDQERSQPGWIRASDAWDRNPYDATLLIHDGKHARTIPLPDLTIRHPYVQLLPNSEVLLVFSRSERLSDGTYERNAVTYSADGTRGRSLTFGDGIADVQTTATGEIWVSYFDEGIFGNDSWTLGDETIPVGATGLELFDRAGNRLWQFSPPANFDYMADCYALNVTNSDVFAYYYTDFPIVRIDQHRGTVGWETKTSGCTAFATDGNSVLLFGGYYPFKRRCQLGRLGDAALEDVVGVTLTLPSNIPVPETQVYGRGPVLHAFAGTSWYQIDIREL